METIYAYLPQTLKETINAMPSELKSQIEEIRVRIGKPIEVIAGRPFHLSHIVTLEEGQALVNKLSQHSFYALDEELRCGYLTIEGGHRVGLAGKVILEEGKVKALRYLSSFNLRIAREKPGVCYPLIPWLFEGKWKNTLIIGAPQTGKTTLLRDLARTAATGTGIKQKDIAPVKVGIVDERSEIAGCVKGIPQLDIGLRTDILDACPKAEGMMMMIRSMSPDVLVADEIGRAEDGQAVAEAINAGITLIATAHGSSYSEVVRRPIVQAMIESGAFERFIELSSEKGVRSFKVLDQSGQELMSPARMGQ
ncbi:stage III sporulation protein AA [Bacillus sp. FJAT-27231]|uniref:stage III sporulation protein AA n=1 Tax=Bacillus sp. FJAT-27231 TaxID=1679168 RepID=UPI0006708FE1|nr:stage III sporulation protein AA [Bacillus sp. FJAT-27231]KMY54733.1 stage III sporulation protein AA [Bacillus sp. FJAT-27231]